VNFSVRCQTLPFQAVLPALEEGTRTALGAIAPQLAKLLLEQIGRVQAPTSDGLFSDCIHLPELGDRPDDQAVLQYALGREHAAMEQYRELAESSEPGPIRNLFVFLANEETQHKAKLKKVYCEVVHSGGV
jgi:hypothetical protein